MSVLKLIDIVNKYTSVCISVYMYVYTTVCCNDLFILYIYINFPIFYKFLQKHRNLKKFKEQKIEKNFLSAKKKNLGSKRSRGVVVHWHYHTAIRMFPKTKIK